MDWSPDQPENIPWSQPSPDAHVWPGYLENLTPTERPVASYGHGGAGATTANGKKEWQCLYPGCKQKPFGRSADMERHIQKIHFPHSQKEKYNCDYKRCQRSNSGDEKDKSASGGVGPARGEGFTRRDHYRDHLRDFHKEDILKRGQGGSESMKWLRDRQVDLRWWRCGKCLNRIKVDRHRYQCPDCRQLCEHDRQVVRKERIAAGSK